MTEKECKPKILFAGEAEDFLEKAIHQATFAEKKRVLDEFKNFTIIVTGYTGISCCDFAEFHRDVEKRLRRPVMTHEFGQKETWKTIKEAYKEDFIKISKHIASLRLKGDEKK